MAKRKTSDRRVKTKPKRNPPSAVVDQPLQKDIFPQYQVSIIIISALVLLVIFLYTIQIVVSPFLVAGVIVFILYPIRQHTIARRIIWTSILLFIFWFFYTIIGVFTPFILSFGIAYVLNPIISRLEERKIPRWAGSLGVLLLITALVAAALFLLLPVVFEQFNDLIQNVTAAVTGVGIWLQEGKLIDWLDARGIPTENIRVIIDEEILPKLEDATVLFVEGVLNLFIGLAGYITQIINMVVIPFLTFYLMKDFPAVKRRVRLLIPDEFQPDVVYYYRKIDQLLGRYIRGYIILATINGTLAGLLLWMFGIKYPVVLGIITGLLDFIPYIGLIVTMIIAAIVAFLSDPPILLRVSLAVISIGGLAVLENYVLAPYILGRPIGLHPVVLILCLLVFFYFLGFVGLLIALPTTAIINLFIKEWDRKRREEAGMLPLEAE